jgi:anti-sigma regulatory factor (Ser/Thr protein kinase)
MQTAENTAQKALVSFERVYDGMLSELCQVRADIAAALDECPEAEDVILLTSELAANAVIHSRSGQFGGIFTVRAEIHDTYAWIEVEDQGGDWAAADHQDDDPDEHGRGLAIVAAVAGDGNWGTEPGDAVQSRVVWARIERQS